MRRILIGLIIVLAVVPVAEAQDRHPLRFQASIGPSVPAGPSNFRDYWYLGPSLGTGVAYRISPTIEGLLHFDLMTHTLNDKRVLDEVFPQNPGLDIVGGRVTVFSLTANLKASLPVHDSRFTPYFLGGLGISKFEVGSQLLNYGQFPILGVDEFDSAALVTQFGIGTDIRSSLGVDFYTELRLILGTPEGTSFTMLPLRFGIRSK